MPSCPRQVVPFDLPNGLGRVKLKINNAEQTVLLIASKYSGIVDERIITSMPNLHQTDVCQRHRG